MIILHEKLFVGIRPQSQNESKLPLAFATPFGTDKAYEKRKATVEGWTGGEVKPGSKHSYQLLDNVLLDGFRISQSVRRYGWNGGNVVWRIEDPRGFELEISSSNFASIVDCTTLTNGVIEGKCIWGREGGTNILIPEASQPYIDATNFTDLSKLKVSSKDLKPGQFVRMKDDTIAMFCGEYFGLGFVKEEESRGQEAKAPGAPYWQSAPMLPPFYKYTMKALGKRAVFMREEAVDEFLKLGTLPEHASSPEYYGFSDSLFSYSGFKTVAKLEPRKEELNQELIMKALEVETSYTSSAFPNNLISLVSLTAFKTADFTVVPGKIKFGAMFLKKPDGSLSYLDNHNFHDKRWPLTYGDDKDVVSADTAPFDLESFKVGETIQAIEEKYTYKATDPVLVGWTEQYLTVTANGRSGPVRARYYGRNFKRSLFDVVPSQKRG